MLAPSKQSVRRSSAGGDRLAASHTGTSYNYTSNALNQYTAVNTEQPTYDADGNMLTRDGWTQVWNGENRLIEISKGNVKLQFAYDYRGRRVEKKVYSGTTLTQHTRFVYDGFKLAEELDAPNGNAVLRRYSWQPDALGLDVPLSVFDASANASYSYTTDANKNIAELTDANGNVVTHYEYSPFGQQTKANGTYASSNPFRFSSEYYDTETGLVYYNYRYYDTGLGRWLLRDPIGERGGVNIYSHSNNNCVNMYDLRGLGNFDVKIARSEEFRKRNTVDVYGYEVRYNPSRGECNGSIVIVQYIKVSESEEYRHDGFAPENRTENGYKRKGAYTDEYYDPKTKMRRGGFKSSNYTSKNGAYIDAPITHSGLGNYPQRIMEMTYFIKVKAYCRCDDRDDRFLKEYSFKFQRYADGGGKIIYPRR